MAGEDRTFLGEAFQAEGMTVGFLQQEPKLDPVEDRPRERRGRRRRRSRALLNRYDEINAKFGEDLSPEEMDKVLEEQGKVQDRDRGGERLGPRFAGRARDGRAAAAAGRR